MDNMYRVMSVSNSEGVELVSYQIIGMVYQWYDKWEEIRGKNIEHFFGGIF